MDLGLRVSAMTVTEKLMPILQVCRVDRSHPYFFEENFGKKGATNLRVRTVSVAQAPIKTLMTQNEASHTSREEGMSYIQVISLDVLP